MNKQIKASILLVLFGLISCETNDTPEKYISYLEYLKDKTIIGIHIQGDTKYVLTSRYCDTCYVAPEMSFIPTIEEWTVINDSTYNIYSPTEFSGLQISDYNGNLYMIDDNDVYKLNDVGEKDLLLSTGDFNFVSFAFDADDNIWFYSDNSGIAFWNKTELKVYNTQNSQLPTNIIYGLGVDKSGIVWASLGHYGLLKIENNNWIVIPNEEIPGLGQYSYLRGPKIVQENSIWFEVFRPDTTSNVLKFENNNWIYEFPDNSKYCNLIQDSNESIWAIINHFDNGNYNYTTLKHYANDSWIDFNITDVNTRIVTMNADDNTVFLGTLNGLIEKTR